MKAPAYLAHPPLSRRTFLGASAGCAGHIALMLAGAPPWTRRAFAARPLGRVVAREPWGRIENIGDGLWAMISTPLEDGTTLCNGGIVAGRNGVVAIESFATPAGATWLSEQARALTGRRPTHIVLTHYHSDHTGGITGYGTAQARPDFRATNVTRDLVLATDAKRAKATDSARASSNASPVDPAREEILADVLLLPPDKQTEIDLGDRRLRIVPRAGHTKSDVSIELDEPSVVFCGDLLWNGMFPNYVDAIPSVLARSVDDLIRTAPTVYVPGHGELADAEAIRRYTNLLDDVGQAARRAIERGIPPADAARDYKLPAALSDWILFSPRYFEVAFTAWAREAAGG